MGIGNQPCLWISDKVFIYLNGKWVLRGYFLLPLTLSGLSSSPDSFVKAARALEPLLTLTHEVLAGQSLATDVKWFRILLRINAKAREFLF